MNAGNIPITGTITTTNELDTYPTHWDKYAKGGHRTVATIEQRNAITEERRSEGMQVYVTEIRQLQQLIGGIDNTKWVTLLTIDNNDKIKIDLDLTQIDALVAAAAKSANDADASAIASSRYATTSAASAIESTGAAGLALGYAQEAGESVVKAYAVLALCSAEVTKSADYASDSSDYADTAKAASKVAGERRDEALNSANAALTYYNNLKATGLNALPNSGDVDINNFRIINLENGINPQDAATVAQITAASTGVQSVLGEPGQINSTGGQNPVISLSPQLGLNNLPNFADINAQGFAIVNAAPGAGDNDLATIGQLNSIGNSVVKSVSGTAGQINSTGGANPIISISPQLGLNNLSNFADVDFKGYKAINAADAVSASDLVTFNQLKTSLDGYIKSVNGTSGQINVTPGQNPVVSIANTPVTAGFYRLANVTTGSDGRLTFAGSTTVSGNTGRILVFNAPTNVNVDLATTSITAGSYNLSNPTFDAYGRATACTSTVISGTNSRISITGSGTSAMSIDLVNTGVTPGTYNFLTATIGDDGRTTNAVQGAINGNTGRVSVLTFGSIASVDLVKTAIVPGTYSLANPTFDAYGRATAATSTTISGTSQRVTVTGAGTTSIVIDLAKIGTIYAPAIGQYRRVDEYGRIVHNEECYFNSMTTGGQTAVTTIAAINVLQPANLAVPTTNESTNMFSYNGGTTGIKINTQYATKKIVSQEVSFYSNLNNEAIQIALIKNFGLSGAKMFAHRQLYSIVNGQPYSVNVTGLVDLVGGDTVHLVYGCGVVGRTIVTTSHSWLLR